MFDTMLSSIGSVLTDSLLEISQNPISLTIFSILALLIISLAFAMIFPSWRDVLVRARFLEEDERPSSLLLWIIAVMLIVKILQTFIVQPFIVDGGSMLPTFHNQEFLLVDKLSYRLGEPKRGDVMVFKLEESGNPYGGKHLIKRVIGLPGERIVIKGGVTTIYNTENPEGFILDEPYVTYKDTSKTVDRILDEHHYFMMGDNRSQSYDSRDWGPLEAHAIRGQVLLRVLPFSVFGLEPGRYQYEK